MSVFSAVLHRNLTNPFLLLWSAVRRPDGPLRRATALIRLGDALSVTRPRNWEQRSRRAYRKAARILEGAERSPSESEQDPARLARGLARSRAGPVRLAVVRLALSVAVALALGASAAVAAVPGLRSSKDLAEGRPWKASSAHEGYRAEGIGPSADTAFFHTERQHHPWVAIELEGTPEISAIVVENRADCCGVRALPLNIEVLDGEEYRLACQRRAAFSTYTCRFPPVRTRSVRLHVAATEFFHLKRVAIFE
jgi:hypothetical protein